MEWLGNQLKVDKPKRPKKITGTRFASIMGLNPWSSEFATWCEITKTYQEPFEDTIYTIAGKTIEPKQAEYVKKAYFLPHLITPTDVYGEDYFNKTYGDFFPENKVLGGMWDYLNKDDGKKVSHVLEMKTTKRAEDWKDDIPEYYAMQGALYAYLLGVDDVLMVVSFLEEKDYAHPEKFKCTAKNTKVIPFKVSERYPDMKKLVKKAETWYRDYVETGISPAFDEKVDEKILKELRKNNVNPDTDVESLLKEADKIIEKLAVYEEMTKPLEDRLENIKGQIKQYAQGQFRDGDKKVELSSSKTVWTLSKSVTTTVDKKKLEKDKLLEKYSTQSETYRLTSKAIKEEE